MAGSLILFQVSFTRLVSYKLFYHFVFLAISLSLLGLGAAGTFVALRPPGQQIDRRLQGWLAALACSVPLAFYFLANPLGVTHHPPIRTKLLGWDAIAYLLWCSPWMIWLNFCGGVVLTSLFARYSAWMGRLYAADLLGAAAGSLGCVAMMKYGSPPAAFVGAVVPIVAALLLVRTALGADPARRLGAGATLVAVVLAAALFAAPPWVRNFQNFPTVGRPHRTILKYDWNHLIRTDHVPGWYVLDGEAATQIVPWTPAAAKAPPTEPAYALSPARPSVAIIGVGGGRQLAQALRAEARRVVAIDINPTILGWLRHEDRGLNNDLFWDPRVELVEGEGRHSVRSAGERFDVVVIHAIDTYAAAASGAYALTENFLYTKEAFLDYYHALSDDGVLSVSRWLFNPPRENLRLFSTALAALEELGVADPKSHLVVAAPVKDYARMGERRVWGYLLMSRRPFLPNDVARLRATLARRGWSLLFAPDARTDTPFDAYAHAEDRRAFQAKYPYLILPVTDSSPYLFQFYNPLHKTAYHQARDWATVHIYQWSAVTLLLTLAAAVVLSVLFILAPLAVVGWRSRRAEGGGRRALRWREVVYFAGLGVGFMAFEIPIIQVLSLYLGHPTYGFAVVLVALLTATGLGSLLVDRLTIAPSKATAAVAGLLMVAALAVFPFVHATLDQGDGMRFVAALAIVAICGVPMGFPLALAVRIVGRTSERNVAWAWGINGASSVVGACLVMILMVFVGSVPALVAGAGCYAASAWAARAWSSHALATRSP